MSNRWHIPVALYVGFLGATIQLIDVPLHTVVSPNEGVGLSWVAFLAWATYFFSGCTLRGGLQEILGIVVGMVLSIGIMELGSFFPLAAHLGIPLAIFILVPCVIMLEKAPFPFDGVPAIFIGAGAYFALATIFPQAPKTSLFTAELCYALLGILFGWLTITGRSMYERLVGDTKDTKENV